MKTKKGPARARQLLDEGEYGLLLRMQDGVCAICWRPPRKYKLSVDHDHRSGEVRGLLCHRCNRGLQWFGDDATRLNRAAHYVMKR